MYYRKLGDEKKRKRCKEAPGFPHAWYYDTDRRHWKRCYRGKDYTDYKRIARRRIRRRSNITLVYSKHYYDLWWNAY